MRRWLPWLWLVVVSATAALSAPAAIQEKTPKKRVRIAVADPAEAAKDPDFAVQGEYVGGSGEQKLGAQVIARGLGEFEVVVYQGGLPGAGADMTTARRFKAARQENGSVTLQSPKASGTLQGGKFQFQQTTLEKIERQSPTLGARPPAQAVILFAQEGDEKNHWDKGKLLELSDGKFLTVSKTGNIRSKQKFNAFTLHLEFRLAWMPNSTGQARSNSGVYLQDRYECQVLDSFGLKGENNECGGIYTQHKPRVNMCFPPMVWQTYDIDFTPAVFDDTGKKVKNARATIRHNGVIIHENIEFPRETPGGQKEGPTPGPLHLQDHGDPVVYRNIWIVPKD
ncbi:MAG: DUF1080 domain-containing protein [Thermogemmata sp.]|jgi:hypothetical protein|uniref:DUF1080 domain-containing protein n=1 Tax=Thermogemmata fonticola TaxID=2755323 RepID=A0A7V8VFL0_9BACT|nr:DUF1080 domain-containing protein [Thermogemmata fonticola]MBA2227120.1 DUF1080 domain-containing protein [Thermogemmata fonticola]MCX8140535.1 DUF1080 domain-containing protein [Gemmataceae bacterium]